MTGILAENGLSEDLVQVVYSCLMLSTALFGFVFGIAIDYTTSKNWLLFVMMCAHAASCFLCTGVMGQMGNWGAAVLGGSLGVCEGSCSVVFSYFPAYWFGREHLGSLQSVSVSVAAIGSGASPMVLAFSKAYAGSFGTALFWIGSAQSIVGVLCMLIAKPALSGIDPRE